MTFILIAATGLGGLVKVLSIRSSEALLIFASIGPFDFLNPFRALLFPAAPAMV